VVWGGRNAIPKPWRGWDQTRGKEGWAVSGKEVRAVGGCRRRGAGVGIIKSDKTGLKVVLKS
jgi:hypothetical protein